MASFPELSGFFPKSRLSASDFKPFSAARKPHKRFSSDSKPNHVNGTDKQDKKTGQNFSRDLNLFNFCPGQIELNSSSSDDESDVEEFQSKPSSSSGSTGKTSKSSRSKENSVKDGSNGPSPGSSKKSSPSDLKASTGGSSGEKGTNGRKVNSNTSIVDRSINGRNSISKTANGQNSESKTANGQNSESKTVNCENFVVHRNGANWECKSTHQGQILGNFVKNDPFSSLSKSEILLKVRQELFTLPGDTVVNVSKEESSEEENVIEASRGRIVSPKREKTDIEIKGEPKSGKSKEQEDMTKSKLLTCPVCGKIIIEKTAKLSDHYLACHTPQRSECLGHIPTHRHSDGTAFVRLDASRRLTGHQCFVCYRLCENSRELRLHWQLHKVYVSAEEAQLAPDDDELNTSSESCELHIDLGNEESSGPTNVRYDVKQDLSEPEENEFWNSETNLTDDEDEDDVRERALKFKQNSLQIAGKIACKNVRAAVSADVETIAKTVKMMENAESSECVDDVSDVCRRCPDCDVIFSDVVTCSQHRQLDHVTKLMYRCVREDCRQVFNHHRAYRDHHRRHHRQRAFICSLCNDHFSVYGQLMAHRRRQHRFLLQPHPKIVCNGCQTAFPSQEMLNHHVEASKKAVALFKNENFYPGALESNQVRCLICCLVFEDHALFDQHIGQHFNKEYLCPSVDCAYVAEDFIDFKIHFRSHYDVSDTSVSCPRCRKVSVDNAASLRHRDTCMHHCRLCKKPFVLEEEILAHFLKTHHWLILLCPFCCEVIPWLKDNVEHHKRHHLALHAVGCVSEEPRINVSMFNEKNAKFFPNLLKKFPDLASGFYGFVSLGTRFFPPWWKLPEQELLRKREKVPKRKPNTEGEIETGSKRKRGRPPKNKPKPEAVRKPEVKIEVENTLYRKNDRNVVHNEPEPEIKREVMAENPGRDFGKLGRKKKDKKYAKLIVRVENPRNKLK